MTKREVRGQILSFRQSTETKTGEMERAGFQIRLKKHHSERQAPCDAKRCRRSANSSRRCRDEHHVAMANGLDRMA